MIIEVNVVTIFYFAMAKFTFNTYLSVKLK
jgi:hypothetical protein